MPECLITKIKLQHIYNDKRSHTNYNIVKYTYFRTKKGYESKRLSRSDVENWRDRSQTSSPTILERESWARAGGDRDDISNIDMNLNPTDLTITTGMNNTR